ncbi:hypothetical protein KC960_00415, partial [Candidatus Saccharibacteria bacterium]|nr:hypothetical protein [Candidatus Saccharibacteria bacterium]
LVQLDGSGLINDSLLSSNVTLLNGTQTFTGTNSFNSGGVVLGQTTLSSSATVSRAISFPDESGTICLTDSDTCGYLRFASGIAQTDSSNNNTISINKTSASGSLIDLQRSGGAVFTVANSGALQIQSTSSTALDIRNGSGNSYFIVDTNTGLVQVGPGVADATGILFVLDTKNTTGDPTGIDGGIYYNSADGKNRCYENGYWSDCSTTRVLGENTITSANTTITVNLAESTEYLHCRVNATGRSANAFPIIRFNGDSGGASYGWNTYGITGTTVIDSQDSSDSEIQLSGTATSNIPFSANLYISNTVGVNAGVDWTMAGIEPIGTQVNRFSGAGVWGNTSAITSVTFTLSGTATFNSGSYAWCEGRNIR